MTNKIYPFKFLDAYTAEDKDLFFGREEEVQQLYEMIYQSDTLLLYGASGTGKTSLIQCGLASRFQQHDWLDVFVRRHKNLNESLEKALLAVGGEGDATSNLPEEDLDWLEDLMGEVGHTTTRQQLSPTQTYLKNIYLKHFRPIYLIFDQFEELFILGSAPEQQQFIQTVQEILQVEQPVKLIFSIREEYLGSLYEFEKAVPQLLRKKLRIDPMNLEKAKAVVLGATRSERSIVHIQESEAEAIAEGVFEKIRGGEKTLTIQLPYLQVFLDKFYRHISKDKSKQPTTEATFTLAALAELGDISDILRDFLDEQIIEIAKEQGSDHKTIWKILSPFVTVDGTKEPIGLESLHQQLPDISNRLTEQVVLELMNRRILRYLEDEELYEVAHDSLALRIAEKRSDEEIALLEVRNLIQSQSLLKDEARELFSEKQLEFIGPYLPLLVLTPPELQLLEESRQEVERQQKAARKRKIIGALLLFLFFAIILGFALYSQAQKAMALKAEEAAVEAKEQAIEAKEQAIQAKDAAERDRQEAIQAKRIAEEAQVAANDSKVQAQFAQQASAIAQRQAEEALRATERARVAAIMAEENALLANKKNEKIINAMDFYEDELALAFNNGKYGFINKEGEVVIDYEYDKGEPFDSETGYAEMEVRNVRELNEQGKGQDIYIKYLVDKEGNRLRLINVAQTLRENGYKESSPTLSDKDKEWLESIKDDKERKGLLDMLQMRQASTLDAYESLMDILIKETHPIALDFKGLDQMHITATFTNVLEEGIEEKIFSINLTGTNLPQLPDKLGRFKNLEELDISYTGIDELPDSFTDLKKLRKFTALEAQLWDIPSNIGQLQQLEELQVTCKFGYLHSSLFEIEGLRVLKLEGLDVLVLDGIDEPDSVTVPPTIRQLKNLEQLELQGNIHTIAKEIEQLDQLKILNINSKKLSQLPSTIGNLDQLQTLIVNAPIRAIPESIANLKQLEVLSFLGTEFSIIPTSITQLSQLKGLVISASLTSLPKDFAQLQSLKVLALVAPLSTFPEEILALESLVVLTLKGTNIQILPSSIGRLKNLTQLSLEAPLKNFPQELFKLQKLGTLSLTKAKLTNIPDNIDQLNKMKQLTLSGVFQTFPSSILKLKELISLELSSPNLSYIPASIGQLPLLTTLELTGDFKTLPSSVGQLKNLVSMKLISPSLEKIPAEIGNLRYLASIKWMGSFEQLPSTIYNLKKLIILDLRECLNMKTIPDLSKFKRLSAFGYTLQSGSKREELFNTLQDYKGKHPEMNLVIFDENGNFVDVTPRDFD